MIRGIHHVGVSVSDLEKSREFYCELLGFRIINSYENAEEGLNGIILELNGQKIELFQSPNPIDDPYRANLHALGVKHIALAVDDVRKEYERLHSAGVEINEPTMGKSGSMYCHFLDPDGIQLEIYEIK